MSKNVRQALGGPVEQLLEFRVALAEVGISRPGRNPVRVARVEEFLVSSKVVHAAVGPLPVGELAGRCELSPMLRALSMAFVKTHGIFSREESGFLGRVLDRALAVRFRIFPVVTCDAAVAAVAAPGGAAGRPAAVGAPSLAAVVIVARRRRFKR